MTKSIESLEGELDKLRTGRAHPSLLDHLRVDHYGSPAPLNQVCSIAVEDASTLALSVWDKNMTPLVEKAILESDLGLNPVVAGATVRVPLPPLTEERRRDLVKVVRRHGEGARVAIRNIRRDANQAVKDAVKEKTLSLDDKKRVEEQVQQLTDRQIAQVEALLAAKEKALLAV